MNFKKIIKYLLITLPWFLSSLIFKIDTNYYKTLNLPIFAPPSYLFPIVWIILFILIGISIYQTISKSNSFGIHLAQKVPSCSTLLHSRYVPSANNSTPLLSNSGLKRLVS